MCQMEWKPPGAERLGLLYARLGVVVSEVAALPLYLGRLEERIGRAA